MASKRKIPSTGLERRVRPRREEEWEPEPDISDGSSGDEEGIPEEGSRSDDDQDEDDESNSSQDSEVSAYTGKLPKHRASTDAKIKRRNSQKKSPAQPQT